MGTINQKKVKCDKCQSPLEIYVSPCTDHECCGLDHEIKCSNDFCGKKKYTTDDYYELVEKWISIGGKKKDFD